MTLKRLIEGLQEINDKIDAPEIEVVVSGWDDNFYDGNKIEGLRLTRNVDYEQCKAETVLFVVIGNGR